MRRIWGVLLLVIVMLAVFGAVPKFRNTIRQRYIWYGCKPYGEVRNATAKVKLVDVKLVKLESPFRPSVFVSDRSTQRLLLRGLQGALLPPQVYKNRVEHAIVVLKGGKRLETFGFSTRREVDAFSPSFVEGLRRAGIRVPDPT